jgi:hypothetical protein
VFGLLLSLCSCFICGYEGGVYTSLVNVFLISPQLRVGCLCISCHCVLAFFAFVKGVFVLSYHFFCFLFNYEGGVYVYFVTMFLFLCNYERGVCASLVTYFFVQLCRKCLCLYCHHVFIFCVATKEVFAFFLSHVLFLCNYEGGVYVYLVTMFLLFL